MTLGPYDYWAIEYAYKPLEPAERGRRAAADRGARRRGELAYATDEDNFLGIDPDALHFDLGNDVAAFAKKRIAIARDLFKRQETREFRPGQDYTVLRRSLAYAVGDVADAVGVLARQIGGVRTLRDFPGSGRDPLQPVAAGAAARGARPHRARPVLGRRPGDLAGAAASPRARLRGAQRRGVLGRAGVATDFSLAQRVLSVQRTSLGAADERHGRVAHRSTARTRRRTPAEAFQLAELYGAAAARDLERARKPQRHRTGAPRAAARARQPPRRRRAAAGRGEPGRRAQPAAHRRRRRCSRRSRRRSASARYGADTQAHLQDSADTLSQALAARLQRAGV